MSYHFQKGEQQKIAFVFSCPGQQEEKANKPAAGTTGKNLENLLKLLKERLSREDMTREDITIANAWDKVEYEIKSNRTEATDKEIISHKNIVRLNKELINIEELIVCCGKKAMLGVCQIKQNLNRSIQVLYVEHLGIRGLNSIKKDINGNEIISAEKQGKKGDKKIQNLNTLKRLEVICDTLIEQLNRK